MKISAHTNITNALQSGYPVLESLRSFANLCDEVIVVDGGSIDGGLEEIEKIPKVKIIQGEKWERDFDWTIMPKNLQIGFEECKGDWVFHFDVDYIFHEDNVLKLKKALENCHLPAMELQKCNLVLVNEYFEKDYYPFLVNKKEFSAIGYGIARDEKGNKSATFLRPIIRKGKNKDGIWEGEVLKMSTARVQRENINVYTYDFTFMSKEQIIEQRVRFENALTKYLDENKEIKEDEVFERFMQMMIYRHNSQCQRKGLKLEWHSQFIREKVINIKPEQFGYDMFNFQFLKK